MKIEKLGLSEMRALYDTRMKEDFPPSELRPWHSMETLTQQGNYLCFGYKEGDRVLAYAAFARSPEAALLDYYAVDASLRGQGVGQRFLVGLKDLSHQFGAPFVLIEVESVETGKTPEEKELRQRRIRFYEHCGCRRSGTGSLLFGVEYQIMYLPLDQVEPQDSQVKESLEQIYRMIVTPLVQGDSRRYEQACRVFLRENGT